MYRAMIQFTRDTTQPGWYGYFYSILLLLAYTLRTIFMQLHLHHAIIVGMRMRTVIIAAVYSKVCILY